MALDYDNVFKFCTPKYVYIRDAKLGIMKFFFMGSIFCYIVLYEIMYSCSHLLPHHAQGFGTLTMAQPSEECKHDDKECMDNFHNVAKLPYCSQYMGDSESAVRKLAANKDKKTSPSDPEEDGADKKADDEDAIGKTITKPKLCQYLDHNRLEFGSNPSEAFIPTHYKRTKQTVDPSCYNALVDSVEESSKKYRCPNIWKTVSEENYYVADIEEFKLNMFHSFNSPNILMSGVSADFQGFFAACPVNHPKDVKTECKRVKIPNSQGAASPDDLAGLTSVEELGIESLTGISGADEISLRDLLKATPVAQAHNLKTPLDAKLPASLGHPGESLREVGGMLLLDVNYANNAPMRPGFHGFMGSHFDVKPVTYEYRPYFIPSRENKVNQVIQVADNAKSRVVDQWYGLTIKFQFNGQLVKFTWQGLLKSLTTALVLVTAASSIVCMLAANVMPLKEKYSLLMYQLSEDFSDYSSFRKAVSDDEPGGWEKRQAARVSGQKLLDKLGPDGQQISEISNQELCQILSLHEMRMARLDGADPKLVFVEADEDNPINKAIGLLEQSFYAEDPVMKKPANAGILKTMAFNQRLGKGAE